MAALWKGIINFFLSLSASYGPFTSYSTGSYKIWVIKLHGGVLAGVLFRYSAKVFT